MDGTGSNRKPRGTKQAQAVSGPAAIRPCTISLSGIARPGAIKEPSEIYTTEQTQKMRIWKREDYKGLSSKQKLACLKIRGRTIRLIKALGPRDILEVEGDSQKIEAIKKLIRWVWGRKVEKSFVWTKHISEKGTGRGAWLIKRREDPPALG